MLSELIIVGTISLFGYGIYKVKRVISKKHKKQIELLRKQEAQEAQKAMAKKVFKELYKQESAKYQIQIHREKYYLYPLGQYFQNLTFLYRFVVCRNLWMNEPFHSKFYQFLLAVDNNDFMILDPNSKVITMNIRDKNNKIQTSNSYQVYSTGDVIKTVIVDAMEDIKSFYDNDAQNIIIAVFIVVLEQSVHNLSKEAPKKTLKELLKDYEHSKAITNIAEQIEKKDSRFYFIIDAFDKAFRTTSTFPYNDSEPSKLLQLPKELPAKSLQEI